MGKKGNGDRIPNKPREWDAQAKRARPDAWVGQRGRHHGVEVDGHFIPTGNHPNQELPVGTNNAIKRAFIRLGLLAFLIGVPAFLLWWYWPLITYNLMY